MPYFRYFLSFVVFVIVGSRSFAQPLSAVDLVEPIKACAAIRSELNSYCNQYQYLEWQINYIKNEEQKAAFRVQQAELDPVIVRLNEELSQLKTKFLEQFSTQASLETAETLFDAEDWQYYDGKEPGIIATFNGYGSNVIVETRLTRQFNNDSTGKDVVDIGSGLGPNSFRAIRNAPNSILITDLSAEHIRSIITTSYFNPENVWVDIGKFPENPKLAPSSKDSILISHVFHYMTSAEIAEAIERCREALKQDGKLYIQSLTEHSGFFDDFSDEIRRLQAEGKAPEIEGQDDAGNMVIRHPQNMTVLVELLRQHGFEVENAQHYDLRDVDDWEAVAVNLEERPKEAFGIVARKI